MPASVPAEIDGLDAVEVCAALGFSGLLFPLCHRVKKREGLLGPLSVMVVD